MKLPLSRPPLVTLLREVLGWTLHRMAHIPKSQRFTVGQRRDELTLEALLLAHRAAVTDRVSEVAIAAQAVVPEDASW